MIRQNKYRLLFFQRFKELTTPRDDKFGDLQMSYIEHKIRKDEKGLAEQNV